MEIEKEIHKKLLNNKKINIFLNKICKKNLFLQFKNYLNLLLKMLIKIYKKILNKNYCKQIHLLKRIILKQEVKTYQIFLIKSSISINKKNFNMIKIIIIKKHQKYYKNHQLKEKNNQCQYQDMLDLQDLKNNSQMLSKKRKNNKNKENFNNNVEIVSKL